MTLKTDVQKLLSMEFLEDADNVYRTNEFIVRQRLTVCTDDEGSAHILSEDTYFTRTPMRDDDFEFAFQNRKRLDGKRIRSASYTRQYVD